MSDKPTLERKIATALTDVDVQSTALVALIAEVETSATTANTAAEQARTRALDPTVLDPTAQAAMQDAAHFCERLQVALPRLRQRLHEVTATEALARWRAEAHALRTKRDALDAELAETYPRVVNDLVDLLVRAKACNAEISRLGGSPDGSGGLPRISGVDALRDLVLPRWQSSQPWPPLSTFASEYAAMMVIPPNPRFSPGWERVADAARQREQERQQRELAAAEAAKREFYGLPPAE